MMHDDESISDMFTRFTTIINSLKLGKYYPNQELVRKILRCLLKSWTPKRRFKKHLKKGESSKKEEVTCYECNKLGHYKSDCPKLKKNKEHSKKKKEMMATWSDSDNSSFDEESDGEVANIAFIAFENEEENQVHFSTCFSFDELQDAYDELVEYSENLSLKHSSLKKLNNALTCKI
ncbi:LOW QUALITY PROTEIN: zf-CCHC domain-containing protein/UBN2 domain-containing protein [Cephalotus follicularis]|uniref:Zf-CCHC domain-containing protein/UBN2 domain-containing protein n=1 Tax=Cephalotus follicularis TaxID=3775 RepID=A0A1Q3D5H6_CEPFO|nr:LOW QUALITY PROTEIN: zf-CCHC domain-containing protein/UBN2 domain-containing protein [Cephalotus follicularis]